MTPQTPESWILELRQRLASPPPRRLPASEARAAAVLLPLYVDAGQLWVVLTQRADELPQHRSQIAFPGGGLEAGETPWSAALRETWEELAVAPEKVIRLGELDEVAATVSNYRIVPCVGVVPHPLETTPNPAEIADVFSVPLLAFADPRLVEERSVVIDGRQRQFRIYNIGSRMVWGLTAHIVGSLLERLGLT